MIGEDTNNLRSVKLAKQVWDPELALKFSTQLEWSQAPPSLSTNTLTPIQLIQTLTQTCSSRSTFPLLHPPSQSDCGPPKNGIHRRLQLSLGMLPTSMDRDGL